MQPHERMLLIATKAVRASLRSGARSSENDWARVEQQLEFYARLFEAAGIKPWLIGGAKEATELDALRAVEDGLRLALTI